MAKRTPPWPDLPPTPSTRSLLYTVKCSGKYSLLYSSSVSQVSVPMMISGFVISRNTKKSSFLCFMLLKFIFTIRSGSFGSNVLLFGVMLAGDDVISGWPIVVTGD